MNPASMENDQEQRGSKEENNNKLEGKTPPSFKEALVKFRGEKHKKINMNGHAR